MGRILIAEDERRLASFLDKGLRAAGHATTVCHDGVEAAALASDARFDLLVLDIGLPGLDGFGVLRSVRERGDRLPVLILTGHGDLADTVAGLDGGADDYLTKPFVLDELLARVRARLRAATDGTAEGVVAGAGVVLDLRTRRVTVGDTDVGLTARETSMLEVFLRHPGTVLTRDDLLSRVWGHGFDASSNIVDVYVGYLRRKLFAGVVVTVRGAGYRLGEPRPA